MRFNWYKKVEKNTQILVKTRELLRRHGYCEKTEKSYVDWIYRFLFYHDINNTDDFGEQEFTDFIAFLNTDCRITSSTLRQAIAAISFFYRVVLHCRIKSHLFSEVNKTEKQVPVVFTREEIRKVLSQLNGEKKLIVSLLYGSGLSLSECLHLRIKNIDFNIQKIQMVGKNESNSRLTLCAQCLIRPIKIQIKKVRILFKSNIRLANYAGVLLSQSRDGRNQEISREFTSQFLFPSKKLRIIKHTGKYIQFPLSESSFHKTIKEVVRKAGIKKDGCSHSFRHSFATHLLEDGYDIHIIQKLLGHKSIQSTCVYKNLVQPQVKNIISPLDRCFNKKYLPFADIKK